MAIPVIDETGRINANAPEAFRGLDRFEARKRVVAELERLGAIVRLDGHHAWLNGVDELSGAPVEAMDIRAGAALVIAGMRADGETIVGGVEHIDRGYEHFVENLTAAGAAVDRRLQGGF